MTQPIERDPIYRGRRFQTETIELCVRWYITYRLSYRDLAAMMAERGIVVSHTTIMRWVLRYVPEFEKRWNRFATASGFLLAHGRDCGFRPWRTALSVSGGRQGRQFRRIAPARGSRHGCCAGVLPQGRACKSIGWPRKVNLDGNAASHRALRLLANEDAKWKPVVVRCCRYLNNIVEQDHRAIKRRCASMLGLKSFKTAAITFAGIELANRIRKRQFSFGRGAHRGNWSLKQLWDRALAIDANALFRECTRTDSGPPWNALLASAEHERHRVQDALL